MQNDMRDRLIELIREAHTKWCNSTHDFEHTCADHLIENDVVPVVRCKDCKHMHCYTDYATRKKSYNCLMYGPLNFVDGDHYCAYGERKDDNAK